MQTAYSFILSVLSVCPALSLNTDLRRHFVSKKPESVTSTASGLL